MWTQILIVSSIKENIPTEEGSVWKEGKILPQQTSIMWMKQLNRLKLIYWTGYLDLKIGKKHE